MIEGSAKISPPTALERWLNRDPVQEREGINLYGFVSNDPIDLNDAWGEIVYKCMRKLKGKTGDPRRNGPNRPGNPLYHQYCCVSTPSGMKCYGQDTSGSLVLAPGRLSKDTLGDSHCDPVMPPRDPRCFEKCLMDKGEEKRPRYGIGPQGTDCQEWAESALKECKKKCEPARCPNILEYIFTAR